ncbi:hypothetical protein ACWEN3_04680 [Streptomyces sp. NPDC004561]
MDLSLRVAGDLLGTELSDPVDLGGSRRSTVLRCRTAAGGSVIVKSYTREPEALRSFTSEAAGLTLHRTPELLGADPAVPLLVMEDLGAAPTLADVLLADDPKAAAEGLLAWARALGRLAVGSIGGQAEFRRLTARYEAGASSWQDEPWAEQNAAALIPALTGAGITAPPGLAAELARIGTAGGERYPAFTPGDTCPDNNLLTSDGLRLIDFEGSCFQSVFLTAAYSRMPFSSCWCVFRLPEELARETEQAYRAEVVRAYPELADDLVWEAGMRRAVAVWSVDVTVRLLPHTAPDKPMHRTRRPAPMVRQLLCHRWEMARTLDDCPALAATADLLLRKYAADWETAPLPSYPAFGGPTCGAAAGS